MILREEKFEQTDGLGLLQLRGGDMELVLFRGGEPLVYDAEDCEGSVGRFTVLLPSTQSLAAQLQIETNAAQGFKDDVPLQEQVAPLLKLLPNGFYRLSLKDLVIDTTVRHEIIDWTYPSRKPTAWITGYYPEYGHVESRTLIVTQPDKALDETRIDFYANEINRGIRPALIILAAADQPYPWFIIDGHHKLKAHARCGVTPRALCIEFQTLAPVTLPEARQILKDVEYDDIERYLRDK